MDEFFESPKHTLSTTSSTNTIKTEYTDISHLNELLGTTQTHLKLVSVNPSTSLTTTTTTTLLHHHPYQLASSLSIDSSSQHQLNDPCHLSSPPLSPTSLQLTLSVNGNSNVSNHTFRKTEWDVKKLENYVRNAYNDTTPMENMSPSLLNRYLKSFFELAKKSDGMEYEPESLIGFMNSFERYLKTKMYPESLLRGETFKEARSVLKKKRDLVRSIGKLIRTKTKDTCYLLQFHRNLLKEKGLLSRDNPDCLLAEIYLNNMIYFGEYLKEDKAWRGNLNLVWGDMLLERDVTNNIEYLTLATYAKKSQRGAAFSTGVVRNAVRSKTCTQTSKQKAVNISPTPIVETCNVSASNNTPRIYAQRQPHNLCPIEAYKIYRSRRPNNCLDRDSPFYLAPLFKSKNQSKTWYKALAMSCQRLDALFYCLFKKAGVDLTSLVNMSQSQQNLSSFENDDNNGDLLLTTADVNSHHNHHQQQATSSGSSSMATSSNGTSSYATLFNNHHNLVPAQVQVQVQIQVPLSSHHHHHQQQQQQQQQLASHQIEHSQNSKIFLLSPSITTNAGMSNSNLHSNSSFSSLITDTQACV